MKRVLIGGCSFTESREFERKEWLESDRSWKPYSDMLKDDHINEIEVINVGKCTSGNGVISDRIVNALFKDNFNFDFVIVQWSAVLRGFAFDESEFVNRVGGTGMHDLWPHIEEYVSNNKIPFNEVTTDIFEIENKFYLHSLYLIYTLQKTLESHNIPYFMFWGWEQITNKVYDSHKNVIDKIYNENFWRYKTHGGLNEYAIDLIGKERALIKLDFHPTTESHKLFYEGIIKPLLKNLK